MCKYTQYQSILFFCCYQLYEATLGDQASLVKGILDLKTILSVTPSGNVYPPFSHLHKKSLREVFIDFLKKQIYKGEENFQSLGVNFSLPISIPGNF